MMNLYVVLLFAAVLYEIGCSMPSNLGVSCQEHPAYFEGLKPVLLRSWEVLHGMRSVSGMYHVGYDGHRYAPTDKPESMEYDRLDWFWVTSDGRPRVNHVRLSLNRPAKVFMLVPFSGRKTGPNPSIAGWTTEGIVKLVKGSGKPLQYGIYQIGTKRVVDTVYMFSRETDGILLLPNVKWLQSEAEDIYITADRIFMIAEADGTAPILQYPQNPPDINDSISIMPNARCPNELHDLWVTGNTDDSDEYTKGMMWKTWHPQWDPCYWCGYDHEHGSSSKRLMGYEPKFHYTAWKNDQEDESHEGYKGFVFRHGSLFVYIMVHLQSSSMRRVSVRHHTLLLAVTVASTKELLMEVTHKSDFGFIGVKTRRGKLVPLSREERRIHDTQMAEGGLRKFRTINVIDFSKLNANYVYKTPRKEIQRGIYETWSTIPICSANNKLGVVIFDVTDPATGITSASTSGADGLTLGYSRYGRFYEQTGAPRLLRLSGLSAGEDYCLFKLKNLYGGRNDDGSFYTDAYGSSIHDGAGESSVRQFVKPGFNMVVGGRFGAVESWTGLYEDGVFGTIVNYGYGINPGVN